MSGLDIIEGRASTETRAHSSHNGPGWSGWVWVQSDPVNNLLSIVGASKEWSSEGRDSRHANITPIQFCSVTLSTDMNGRHGRDDDGG